jgi:hypothetical protein
MEILIFGGIIGAIWLFSWISGVIEERNRYEQQNEHLTQKNNELTASIKQWSDYSDHLDTKEHNINKRENLFAKLFKERTLNFPTVGLAWAELAEIADTEREKALKYKKRPAVVAANEVKLIKAEKRELIKELVSWKYRAQNYEAIYPWLVEELAKDIDDQVDADIYYSVYTEREREDPVTTLISPEDYRKLSTTERNQLALERYWMRGKKTKWMIGKMYERYIGYLYEKEGWDVQFFGIQKRYEDLGRDLIATKGAIVHVIQCKNWSKFKTIYENHIFQLFGTSFSLGKEYPKKKVIPVFYTSTQLSDTAQEFARRLGIEVYQNKKFTAYPCIKCNISSSGEKIYHLPFDQQYDNIRITPRTGEFYAETVAEAEKAGFRRAFKWSGNR